MDLWGFLSTTTPPTVAIAAAAWLAKRLVEHRLSRETDQFKSNLTEGVATYKAELQRDADRFKNELSVDAHRRNTVFSRLHERRAEIVAEQYRLLAAAHETLGSYVAPMQFAGEPDMDEKQRRAAGAIAALQQHYDQHRIWFGNDICERTDALVTLLRQAYNDFAIHRHAARNKEVDVDTWNRVWQRVETAVPPLRAALEADFRSLLGVELTTPARLVAGAADVPPAAG